MKFYSAGFRTEPFEYHLWIPVFLVSISERPMRISNISFVNLDLQFVRRRPTKRDFRTLPAIVIQNITLWDRAHVIGKSQFFQTPWSIPYTAHIV